MNIDIRTIRHNAHRYDTVGDWGFLDGALHIRVSDLGDWRHETLIGLHEAVEAVLCKHAGISTASVDAFDMAFEEERTAGLHAPEAEPGDHPSCPYHRQHAIATVVERLLAVELGVDWKEYEEAILNV